MKVFPWLKLNGELNSVLLRRFQEIILAHVLLHPGVKQVNSIQTQLTETKWCRFFVFYNTVAYVAFVSLLLITCCIYYVQKQPPKRFFKKSGLFFQEQPFYNFLGGSICSSNRQEFSRRVYRTDIIFPGGSICSSNRPYYLIEQNTNFPRNPYLVAEHIRIFQPYLVLEHVLFSRKVPPSNRYFVNRSRWLLSLRIHEIGNVLSVVLEYP